MDHKTDVVTTAPTLEDTGGMAWQITLGQAFEVGAVVSLWIVEAPWAHPIWHSYSVSVIHLRPKDGCSAPVIYLSGATHEVLVLALNPDKSRQEMIDGGLLYTLRPANFAAQMICPSDEAAAERVKIAVAEVVNGNLNPDTDYTWQWVQRFGDNMLKDRPKRQDQPQGHA